MPAPAESGRCTLRTAPPPSRGRPPLDTSLTLPGLVDALAAAGPDRPAIHYRDHTWSFAALTGLGRRVAGALAGLGVGPGDRIAVWLPNIPQWLVVHLACARLGAVTVCLNTRFRAAEVGDILHRSRARALVWWPGFHHIDFAGILDAVDRAALERLELLITHDEGEDPVAAPTAVREVRLSDLAAHEPRCPDHADPTAGCITFTTSGTTSRPKLVLHPQHSIAAHARDVARGFGYTAPDTVLLQALPLCGTFGHAQSMAALAAGRPVVMLPVFEPQAAIDLVERHRITTFNGPDGMLMPVLDHACDRAIASLRDGGFAAFANPDAVPLVEAAERRGMRLFGLYGMSEVQALYARRDPALPAAVRALGGGRLTGSGALARVVDPDTGEPLAHDTPGELELVGPSRFSGYLDDPAATAACMRDDGFFRTGDLASTDPDGGFTYLTRMGDSLRLGGFLVNPAEIESHLEAHDTVAAAQVVGVPGERGTRPIAFVIPAPGRTLDEAALVRHCRDQLAGFKVPERILPIDRFPTTPSANGEKVQRARLRDLALEQPNG